MPSPINLSNVNISIQQFQAVSNGKYNAGDVKLTGEHTLGKVNNHVHGTGKNRVPLSQAEIVAVKQAFVRTLSESGVGVLEIGRIRRELGLEALEPKDTSLKDRIIRPLSRQQVREILDRNADAINATVGRGTIRTGAQLHAGVSERTLAERARTRETTNAGTAAAREIARHDGIDSFQRIVADDIAPGMSDRSRRAMADQAKELLDGLLRGCNGTPRAGCPATAEWTDPATGAKFTLSPGCDEVEFANRLEEEIVRLQRYDYKAELTNQEWNQEIKASLTDHNNDHKLLPGFRRLAEDAAARAREIFGRDAVDRRIDNRAGGLWALDKIERDLGDVRFSPENLRAPFMRATMCASAKKFLSNHIAPMLAAAGVAQGESFAFAGNILKRHPDLLDRFASATSYDQVRRILSDASGVIKEDVARHAVAAKCRDGLLDAARAIYSEKTGIPLDMLGRTAFDPRELPNRGTKLLEDIDAGRNPAKTKAEITAAFDALRDAFLADIFDVQRQIEETDLPRHAKDWMKFQIPGVGKCKYLRPAAIAAAARQIDLAPLEQAFARKAPDAEIFAALRPVADAALAKVYQVHREATGRNPDGDQINPIQTLLVKALLAGKPALERQIAAFIGREGVMEQFGQDVEDSRALNAFRAIEPDDAVPMSWRAWAPVACGYAAGDPKKVDSLIAAAIRNCGDDADLRRLVFDNLDAIFARPDATLREPWDVAQRIDDLKANLAELRRLDRADPGLYAHGLKALADLKGKALPKDAFARLVQAAWEMPTGDLKGVSARSKGIAIHKAVVQFRTNLERTIAEIDARNLGGLETVVAAKTFLASRMLASLPDADRAGLEAALHSDTGRKLLAHYGSIAYGNIDPALIDTLDADEYDALLTTGEKLRNDFCDLDEALFNFRGGGAGEAIEPFPGHVPPRKFGAPTLERDVVEFMRRNRNVAAAYQQAPQPQPPAANPAADAAFNANLAEAFLSQDGIRDLPAAFREMMISVREEIRLQLGGAVVPPMDQLDLLARGRQVEERLKAPGAPRATPENMRGWYRELALERCARNALAAGVRDRMAAAGLDTAGASQVVKGLVQRDPGLLGRIQATESPAALRAILADAAAAIDDCVRAHLACTGCRERIGQQAREALAARLGIPAAHLGTHGAIDLKGLESDADKLAADILAGANPARADEAIAAAFRALAQRFADERAAALDEADALDLSPLAKDRIKADLFSMSKTGYVRLREIRDAARGFSAADLSQKLADGAPKAEVYAAFRGLYDAIDAWKDAYFAPERERGKEIGPDEIAGVFALAIECVLDGDATLRGRIAAFLDRPDVLADPALSPDDPAFHTGHFRDAVSKGPAAAVAPLLGTAQLPPLHAQALVQAVREEGLEDFSAQESLALFAPGGTAHGALKSTLELAGVVVAPSALKIMARGALRSCKAEVLLARQDAQAIAAHAQAFLDGPGAAAAREMGYGASELPRLSRVFAFAKLAAGLADDIALVAALDTRSNVSRLFSYGGRFTASVANFREGLRLLDAFPAWYQGTVSAVAGGDRGNPTRLNINITVTTGKAERGTEKFLFEEIAHNDSIGLQETDPERVFGMADNPAMRFVGRAYTSAFANSLAQIPPEKRQILYAVIDALDPLATTVQGANRPQPVSPNTFFFARVLRNLDALERLRASGQFDRRRILALLVPDVEIPAGADNRQVKDAIEAKYAQYPDILATLFLSMSETGMLFDEAAAAIRTGRRLPNAPFISTHNGSLEALDGTPAGGRATMLGDLIRPSIPKFLENNTNAIASENAKFVFHFPDGSTVVAKTGADNDPEVRASGAAIADKLAELCGEVHPAQLSALYFSLSQSAIGSNTNRAFMAQGISSDEHMAVTFTISKNDETGAVTVRYTEPAGFPLKFSWETTIALDGTAVSTPMVIEGA